VGNSAGRPSPVGNGSEGEGRSTILLHWAGCKKKGRKEHLKQAAINEKAAVRRTNFLQALELNKKREYEGKGEPPSRVTETNVGRLGGWGKKRKNSLRGQGRDTREPRSGDMKKSMTKRPTSATIHEKQEFPLSAEEGKDWGDVSPKKCRISRKRRETGAP